MAQLDGALSHNQKVAGLIPSPGTYGRQPIDASLTSMFLSFPSSIFKSNEKVSVGEDKNCFNKYSYPHFCMWKILKHDNNVNDWHSSSICHILSTMYVLTPISLQQPHDPVITIIIILKIRKLRPRKYKGLFQGHRASKWWCIILNIGSLAPESTCVNMLFRLKRLKSQLIHSKPQKLLNDGY